MIISRLNSLHVLLLCGRLALSATDIGVTDSTISSQTNGGPFGSPTPTYGVGEQTHPVSRGGSSVAPVTEGVTGASSVAPVIEGVTGASSVAPVTPSVTGATEEATLYPTLGTETPSPTTVRTPMSSQGDPQICLCDLTPDFCDIGCCCDTADCDVANLSTVFTGCPKEDVKRVCIEKWLMFRANVDPSLVTVTDTLFCVQAAVAAAAEPPSLPALTRFPATGDVYHFSPREYPIPAYRRHFHQVDDLIQTCWYNFSVQGFLNQPAPGAASSFCFNRNPAKFLRSTSLSCTRMVTSQSCTTDPDLSSSSYYFNMSLVTVPTTDTMKITSDLLVPVTPLSDWPAPVKQSGFCLNVVKTVQFLVYYTPKGELTNASIDFTLIDVPLQQLVLQTHSVEFQRDTPRPTSVKPKPPAVGLSEGSAVMALIDGEMQPLKSLGVSDGGRCSSDPSRLSSILFTHNTINGCTFSSETQNCTELRSQIYEIFRGSTAPEEIAMNSGLQPNWTRVLIQDCQIDPQESCESGCNLPLTFSIQIVWARQGFIEVPQNHILGAKFLFRCQNVQCPLSSPLTLTAKATFVETTVYPEAPRGVPQPHWRFPFGFFTRGAAELDGHLDTSGCGAEKVTWSLMVFPLLLLSELGFLTLQKL
ncbi:tectonic-3-like isoform X1 [Xiphophorus couchianus]|uniref:tectonic-3-like isoform X1 n=1 Tax=Xiphophorus couchianus TaxID=32473 RepID=UPI0010163376|nr:tectonic-3-like isoform X1 [Xiphophorus couchianus]